MKQKQTSWLYTILTLMFGVVYCGSTYAQHISDSPPFTPNAVFDTIFDKDGNKYLLRDLDIGNINAAPETALTTSCSAGYFNLYFENGSLGSSPSQQTANQAVLCQVFSDVSNFINSPLTTNGLNKKVNIWVRNVVNVSPNPGALAGAATQFYTMAGGPTIGGIVEGEIFKTIVSGNDGYTNVAAPLFTGGSGITSLNGVYFHGMVTFNFTGNLNWNNSLSTAPAIGQLDLYSVALHEITHALGFASLLNNNGLSKFGPNYNYYSIYDRFLQYNNVPLISQMNGVTCANYQFQFNPLHSTAVFTLAGGTCTNNVIFTGTANQKCYCPATFNPGSSISHFQDACHSGSFAVNPGYVMNPFSYNGESRRFLQPEERKVLCDLGYNVNANYGSASVAQGTFAYGGSACPGIGIAGINDGFSTTGNYLYSVMGSASTTVALNIPVSALIANDYNATGLSCIESISSGTASVSGGTVTYTAPAGYFGPILLRYIPTNATSSGNITYVFGFIIEPNCSTVNGCDLIQNGGFENVTSPLQCGDGWSNNSAQLYNLKMSCWYPYLNTADLFTRGCTNSANAGSGAYNLGTNTFSSSPVFNSHNPSANNKVAGMIAGYLPGVTHYNEVIQNFLGAPLINGQQYKLSFWAYNYQGSISYPYSNGNVDVHSINPTGTPLMISFYAGSQVLAPLPINNFSGWPNPALTPIAHQTVTPINQWTYISTVFTYTGSTNGNIFFVSTDKQGNDANGWTNLHYNLIDDISILPVATAPTFSFSPAIFCNNTGTVTNLAQYASPPGGTFSGPGVTYTAGNYNFSPVGLAGGVHQVVYTYTTPTTPVCTLTAVQQVTVTPTFTVTPMSQIIYSGQWATMTAGGSSGTYSWNPGSFTGTLVSVSPTVTTTYTVTNVATGTCSVQNPTIIVSTACSDAKTGGYGSSPTSSVNVPSGSYSISGQILDMQGTITFTGNTTFTGYTFRMRPGTRWYVGANATLTLDNCKLFGCTELWYGITIATGDGTQNGNIVVRNGTTIEDMYWGIHRDIPWTSGSNVAQGSITITDSKLNKNYYSVQLINVKSPSSAGASYNLTVKNSTLTTASSTTSPGWNLKPSTIPSYTYAYNQIAGGASGGTSAYSAFPRSYTGINLVGLSQLNNVVIGDSAGTANSTYNTFSNMDFGIVATNAQLRVHNNYFFNLKGSTKNHDAGDIFNPNPVPIGPDEIGIAIVAQHTVANTYSLQVGSRHTFGAITAPTLIYPKSNIFKTLNKGVSAKNCISVVVKGNWFEADTTDELASDFTYLPSPNTYQYYKSQSAVWVSGLSKDASLSYNYIRNYRSGIYSSFTMSVSAGSGISCRANNIQAQAATGYCRNAISFEQVGGANIPANALEVQLNTITKVYCGISGKNILAGLYAHDNNNLQIDNAKTRGKGAVLNYAHYGFNMQGVQNARIEKNLTVNGTNTLTASNYSTTTAFYMQNSPSCTVTCNSTNNTGRGFSYVGNNFSQNGWLGNAMTNCYNGYELRTNGVIGAQGTFSGGSYTLAANTWSNVTQETFVLNSPTSNSASFMYVGSNVGSLKTAPTLNFGTAGHTYSASPGLGIRINTGTPFSCGGGGCIDCFMAQESSAGNNDAAYNSLSSPNSSVYEVYPDEFMFQNQQYVYQQQKRGLVSVTNNNQLQSFYSSNQNSNIGRFVDAAEALATGQIALAITNNSSISPANAVQQKTKRVNELTYQLNVNPNYHYSSVEIQDLFTYAAECSVKGWYVIQARNILNAISGQIIYYEDNCDNDNVKNRIASEETVNYAIEKQPEFVLHPNPNNGIMTLTYNLANNADGKMQLFDVTGKLINEYGLAENAGSIEINEENMHNGIYFYRILVSEKIIKTEKIVIIK